MAKSRPQRPGSGTHQTTSTSPRPAGAEATQTIGKGPSVKRTTSSSRTRELEGCHFSRDAKSERLETCTHPGTRRREDSRTRVQESPKTAMPSAAPLDGCPRNRNNLSEKKQTRCDLTKCLTFSPRVSFRTLTSTLPNSGPLTGSHAGAGAMNSSTGDC